MSAVQPADSAAAPDQVEQPIFEYTDLGESRQRAALHATES